MAVIPTATISTKNDNYDHSLAPGFIEFSGKQFVFEGSSWPFQLEPVIAVKKKEPGGFLSSALDPLLDLFGSGCEKDDILATVVSGFGILCGEE